MFKSSSSSSSVWIYGLSIYNNENRESNRISHLIIIIISRKKGFDIKFTFLAIFFLFVRWIYILFFFFFFSCFQNVFFVLFMTKPQATNQSTTKWFSFFLNFFSLLHTKMFKKLADHQLRVDDIFEKKQKEKNVFHSYSGWNLMRFKGKKKESPNTIIVNGWYKNYYYLDYYYWRIRS